MLSRTNALVSSANKQAQLTVAQGRGGRGVTPALKGYSDVAAPRQADQKESCPLCISDLDETDRNFWPCPCGYQVCLFCYGQVKEKCSALCPGCRREYGQPVEPHEVIRQPVVDSPPQPAAGVAQQAPRILLVGKSALSPGPGAAQRGGAITAFKTGPGGLLVPEAGTLPTGATWATGPGSQRPPAGAPLPLPPQAAAPSLADESAWPSLDSSLVKPPHTGYHHHGHLADSMRHVGSALSSMESTCSLPRSASSGSASADSVTSRSSSSQDLTPAGRAHQLDTSAFPPLQQQQHPHLTANLASNGTPEASARLVAMLSGQSKAPPPGFAAPAGVSSSSSSLINTQDPSISVLPLGKYQPIQPPSASSNAAAREQQQQQQQQQQLWSMWSGLPGIDLGCVCLSIWPSMPASSRGGGDGDQQWSSHRFGGASGMDLGNGGGGGLSMAPPPGFGRPSVVQHAGYGAQAQFRAQAPGIGMYGTAAY